MSAPVDLKPADPAVLRRLLDGRWAGLRETARELAQDPRFAVRGDLETRRARVLDRMRLLPAEG